MDRNENKNRKNTVFAAAGEKLRGFMRQYVHLPGTNEAERQSELNRRLKTVARGVGFAFLGLLLSRAELPFGVDPFGSALLCAADVYTPYIYVGLAVSSLFSASPLAYFLMYSLGLLLRFSASFWLHDRPTRRMFSESLGLRVMTGVTMAFMIGVYRTVSGGFLYYDLFACGLGLVTAPAAVLVFRFALEKKPSGAGVRDTCLLALTAAGIWSAAGLTLAGFSIASVAAFVVTLYVSRECGMLRGAVAGLFCGLAIGLTYAPMFAVAGLLAGLFWRISTLAATASALAVGFFYSVSTGGIMSLAAIAPDLLCASVIFAPLARFGMLPSLPLYGAVGRGDAAEGRAEVTKKSHEGALSRFEAMQSAFGELADMFRRMSERVGRPDRAEITELTEKCFTSYCDNCARHSLCWDSNCNDTSEALAALTKRLVEDGRVGICDIPEHTARRCFRSAQIVDSLNAAYSARIERVLRENKAEVFADDYEAIADLLGEALRANADEYELDERLTRRLRASAGYLDLPVSGIAAYGKRKKNIVAGGVDLSRVKAGAEDIRRSFERVCGFPLAGPEFSVERGHVTMTIGSCCRYRAVSARAVASKNGEELSGDSVNFFDNSADYFYALLSDGMGSGKEAALTSRLCAVFLSKMLRAGNSKASALSMLNDIVRNKGLECFATIDLLEVDLISGQACFVKSGAAPSYVLRGGSLFRIEAGNCPIGITRELQSEQISFSLLEGDVIIMLSDGIASDLEEALWVADMLTDGWDPASSLEEMCGRIIDEGKKRGCSADDTSVAMIRIERQS